jgi:hypothetical protein
MGLYGKDRQGQPFLDAMTITKLVGAHVALAANTMLDQ